MHRIVANISIWTSPPTYPLSSTKVHYDVRCLSDTIMVEAPRASDSVLCKFRPVVRSKRLMDFSAALRHVFGELRKVDADDVSTTVPAVVRYIMNRSLLHVAETWCGYITSHVIEKSILFGHRSADATAPSNSPSAALSCHSFAAHKPIKLPRQALRVFPTGRNGSVCSLCSTATAN